MGRTQRGNDNAYCQDNEISWYDWSAPDVDLLAFTRQMVAFRRAHPVFRRRRFLSGQQASELRWFTPGGAEMTEAGWSDPSALAVALCLDGSDDPDRAADGTAMVDEDALVLVNGWWEPPQFTVPVTRPGLAWQLVVDSHDPGRTQRGVPLGAGEPFTVGPRSVVVLCGPLVSGPR